MIRRRRLLIEEAKKYNLNVKMWVKVIKRREKACGRQILRQERLDRKKISPFTKDPLSIIYFNYNKSKTMTKLLELSDKAIKNLGLKVSSDVIGLSYENDIVVYEGVIGDTPVRVARCNVLGERANFNFARIFTGNCYITVSMEILEDEPFMIEYIKQSIDRYKKFNP